MQRYIALLHDLLYYYCCVTHLPTCTIYFKARSMVLLLCVCGLGRIRYIYLKPIYLFLFASFFPPPFFLRARQGARAGGKQLRRKLKLHLLHTHIPHHHHLLLLVLRFDVHSLRHIYSSIVVVSISWKKPAARPWSSWVKTTNSYLFFYVTAATSKSVCLSLRLRTWEGSILGLSAHTYSL